jgi:hypothetical protein
MTMEWCKLFNDFADDAKFLRVADITGATVELAQACFIRAMCRANVAAERGSTANIDLEEFAWWFKKPVELIRSLFEAFEKVGRMIKDGHLANWAKRQGAAAAKLAKPVSAAAQRMRRYRRRKADDDRQGAFSFTEAGVTEGVTRVTPGVTQGVTSAVEEETDRDRIPPRGAPPQGGSARARFDRSPGRRTSTAGTTAAEAMTMRPAADQISMLLPIDGEIIDAYRYRRPRRRSPHQTLHEAAIRVGLRAQRARDLSRGQTTQADRGWGMAPAGR